MNLRFLKISLSEDFPALRLIIAAAVIAFTAVVSVYKFIDLSDAVASLFSAPETAVLILSDLINRVFIFLPLYIFVISGARITAGMGVNGIILQGNRNSVAANSLIKVLFYTVIFFAILLIIVLTTTGAAFPKANDFTRTFFGAAGSYGFSNDVLRGTPGTLLSLETVTMFLTYLTIGSISCLISLFLKEGAAFVLTVIIGIGGELLMKNTAQSLQIPVLLSVLAVVCLSTFAAANKRDF
jgi:hypothetical protein